MEEKRPKTGHFDDRLSRWRLSSVLLVSFVWLLFQVPYVSGAFKEIHIGRALDLNLPTELHVVSSDDSCYCKMRCMAKPNCLAVSIQEAKGGKSNCNFSSNNSPLEESSLDLSAITYTKTETTENSIIDGINKSFTTSNGLKVFIYSTYQFNIGSSTPFHVTETTKSETKLKNVTTGASKTTHEPTMIDTKTSSGTHRETEPATVGTKQTPLNSTMMTLNATSGVSQGTKSDTTRTLQNSTMMATTTSSEKSLELKSTTASRMKNPVNSTIVATITENMSSSETEQENEISLKPNQPQINSTSSDAGSSTPPETSGTTPWLPIFPFFNSSSSSKEYDSDSSTPAKFVATYSSELTFATNQNSTQDTCAPVIPAQFSKVPEVGTIWIDLTAREWTEGKAFCQKLESSLYQFEDYRQFSKLLQILNQCFESPNLRNYSISKSWNTDECYYLSPSESKPMRMLSCDVKGYPICQKIVL